MKREEYLNLEQAAVAAFHAGERWHVFARRHKAAILEAERRHPGAVERLLHLLTTGEPSGMKPPPVAEAWGSR